MILKGGATRGRAEGYEIGWMRWVRRGCGRCGIGDTSDVSAAHRSAKSIGKAQGRRDVQGDLRGSRGEHDRERLAARSRDGTSSSSRDIGTTRRSSHTSSSSRNTGTTRRSRHPSSSTICFVRASDWSYDWFCASVCCQPCVSWWCLCFKDSGISSLAGDKSRGW